MTSGPTGGAFGTTPRESTPFTPEEIIRRGGEVETEAAPYDHQTWIIDQDPESDTFGKWIWFYYSDLIESGLAVEGMTKRQLIQATPEMESLWASLYAPSGGRGGRGSGAAGPVYVKPDERLVQEAVRSTLAALAGKVDPAFLDDLTATYMSEAKRSFDLRETEQIDPMETVKAKIRETPEYQAIHKLRPESVDEMDWISSRQGALKRAGVTDKMAQDLGIVQATAGASDQEAVEAGNIATFSQSGQLLDELKERINVSTYSALRLI